MDGEGRTRLLGSGALALAVHTGILAWILALPDPVRPAPVAKEVDRYASLRAIREDAKLPDPEPPPPPPPPKEEPPPPKEEPPPPEAPKPKPRPAVAKPSSPAPAAAPDLPKPLALENVNLTGGVNVQRGDHDTFGDPSIVATKENTKPEAPPAAPSGDGEGGPPPPPPKRIAPRVRAHAKGEWPPDAPRLGRDVEVALSLLVDAEGRVSEVKLIDGAGAVFDDEARRIARRLRFEPGMVGGVPEPMWVPWTVVFQPE